MLQPTSDDITHLTDVTITNTYIILPINVAQYVFYDISVPLLLYYYYMSVNY